MPDNPIENSQHTAIGRARSMRLGLVLGTSNSMRELAREIQDYEREGLDVVTLGEAYGFDAVSQLGYIAAMTSRVELATGILPIFGRSPALTAMSAAGLDYVSEGRFRLGLGTSGPQVVEGFHGQKFDAPLARLRETIDICRMMWRREVVEYHGKHYDLPLRAPVGSGQGKALKLMDRPSRADIPISIAAIGPRSVAVAAEIADGWEPFLFHPAHAQRVWGESLDSGRARRDAALGALEIIVRVPFAITKDPRAALHKARAQLAFYLGGMGSREHNYYNDLATRYGYGQEAHAIQDAFLSGDREGAIAAVPDDLTYATSLIGDSSEVALRLRALREAGVGLVNVTPLASEHVARVEQVSELHSMMQSAS